MRLLVLILVSVASVAAVAPARAATPEAPRPIIIAKSDTGMAPYAVHVHCTESEAGTGSLLTTRPRWDFGDPDSPYNELVGFNAAHLYEQPGFYRITLTLTNEAGLSETSAIDVVITEPSRRKLYVSRRGSDLSRGEKEHSPIRSLARVKELLRADTEVLFERGFDYAVPPNLRIGRGNVVIGAYGEGARPKLVWTGGPETTAAMIHQIKAARDLVVRDLEFECAGPPSRRHVRAIHADGHHVTVQRCVFHNVSYAVRAAGDPRGILTIDNVAGVLGAYFVWGQGADHVHLGNRVDGSLDEHNMRFLADRILVAGNDLTNRSKRTIWALDGSYAWIEGNRLAEGPLVIGPRPQDEGAFEWAVVQGNLISNEGVIVRHGSRHVRLSSNVIERSGAIAIDVWGRSEERGRTCADVLVLGNTAVNRKSGGRFVSIGPDTEGVVVANNMYAAPKLESGSDGACNAFVLDADLGSTSFAGNLWCEPAVTGWGGGWHYVFEYWSNASGFYGADAWARLPQTRDERYHRFGPDDLDNEHRPKFDATVPHASLGLHVDRYGKDRPLAGTITAGAVEAAPRP